jgi:hypothetical protein
MRIWDLAPARLCRQHLLGEHRELHAVWSVITQEKTGYARHPETLRWKGKLRALYARHQRLAAEMSHRGYSHASPLDRSLASGRAAQYVFVDPLRRQEELLRSKGCDCRV